MEGKKFGIPPETPDFARGSELGFSYIFIDRMLRERHFGPTRKSGHPKVRSNLLLPTFPEKSFGIKTRATLSCRLTALAPY